MQIIYNDQGKDGWNVSSLKTSLSKFLLFHLDLSDVGIMIPFDFHDKKPPQVPGSKPGFSQSQGIRLQN